MGGADCPRPLWGEEGENHKIKYTKTGAKTLAKREKIF